MVQNFIANLLRRNKNEEELPYITPILFDESGDIDPVKTANFELRLKQNSTPLTINERLFGRDMEQNYQTINPETGQAQMATLTNHKPGFFEDFGRGYKENSTQVFNVNNLAPVQGKGLATRLGEGLGTLGRFADSSLGRGLIAYGLSNAMGDTNPMEQALTAGVGRQTNLTKDKVYRKQLRQLGMTDNEINSIRGMITDDIYKNIADSYKARWNKASWADLATISPVVAEAVKANPELANSYLPASVAKEIMRGDLTEAQIQNLLARTNLIKAQTGQVGKPKVTVNIKKGGTNSTVAHTGGSGGSDRPTTTGGGRPRVSTQYTQDEIQAELKRRGLI